MNTVFRRFLLVCAVACLFSTVGCRMIGDSDDGISGGTTSTSTSRTLALRSGVPAASVRSGSNASILAGTEAIPTGAIVEVYYGNKLIKSATMGNTGVMFTDLADGEYFVRVKTTSSAAYKIKVTLNSTTTGRVLKATYFTQTVGLNGMKFEDFPDPNNNGSIDTDEPVQNKQLSSGESSGNVQMDPKNEFAYDNDKDGIPNAFDGDIDGDGIANSLDTDTDGDGITNDKDRDVDGDGRPNGGIADAPVDGDIDGDGLSNELDSDVDGDGISNGNDTDTDGDGTANADDPDGDGDGSPNENDGDIDGDGTPNALDSDADGDGILNSIDSTPLGYNGGSAVRAQTNYGSLPTGYSTSGFPAEAGSTITVSAFKSTGKTQIVLVNSSNSSQTVSVTAAAAGAASIRPAQIKASIQPRKTVLTREQEFRNRLREFQENLPPISHAKPSRPRASIRAQAVGDAVSLNLVEQGARACTLKKIKPLPGGKGNTLYYFDDAFSANFSTIETFIDQVDAIWAASDGVYTKIRAVFGEEPGAGTFNEITLTEDMAVYVGPPAVVNAGGYFYSGDLYLPEKISGGVTNQRKIFYMAYDVSSPGKPADWAGIMGHELQHLLHFTIRKSHDLKENPAWLDEAMSGYAEAAAGNHPSKSQSKTIQIDEFLKEISTNSLTEWKGSSADYGQVALFAIWLAEKYSTGGNVKELLTATEPGEKCIESFTKEAFDVTLAKWLVSMHVNDYQGTTALGFKNYNVSGVITFGDDLADITLTGPAGKSATSLPSTFSDIAISPNTAAYLTITGGTGTDLTLTLPSGVTSFEFHTN